jgi:hypothetical protein
MAHPTRRHRSLVYCALLAAGCLASVICAGCGISTAAATTSAIALPTTEPNCASIAAPPETKTTLSFPLPENTVSYRLPGAAGASFYLECTPAATQAAIAVFLNARLPAAGWRRWNAETDNAGGCGTEANSYWQWVKGQDAVGWDFRAVALPEWHLTFCDLAFAS